MNTQSCTWSDVFDNQSRNDLDTGIFVTGVVSALFGVWLNLVLLLTSLRSDLSYRNLSFFTFITCTRRALSVASRLLPFNHSGSKAEMNCVFLYLQHERFSEHNSLNKASCEFFGFWDSFWAVYEVECLTHVCIERYVVAKYNTRGWPIQKNHYVLYQALCVMFSALYSSPPLFGIGRYALDFSCQSCVLDMMLPETWDRFIVVAIFLLRSVKSTGFMVIMLIWARNLESKYENSENFAKEFKFTNSVIILTVANLLCWLPIAVLRCWVVLSQVLAGHMQSKPFSIYIQWATWIHWISPAVSAIAMVLVDERTHQKAINIFKGGRKAEDKKKE